MPRSTRLAASEDQARFFRARRGHLAGPGAPDAAAAARAILGAQAQQLGPALWALALRTEARPTAAALTRCLFESPRSLVRTWGQRDTLHVYDAADWATLVAARPAWAGPSRPGPLPPEQTLDRAQALLESAGRTITRADVAPLATPRFVEEIARHAGSTDAARRFAAGRIVTGLARRGRLCVAPRVGPEQTYAARSLWFDELPWPDVVDAETQLARRYLAQHGPASARDVAHAFGARVKAAEGWVERLERAGEIVRVTVGAQEDLAALAADRDELSRAVPRGSTAWPVRLLPMWDTLLMAHADKRWLLPDAPEQKRVWRPAGIVAAVVLARGRIVATWTQQTGKGGLSVCVEPLSRWRKSQLPGVRREAQALADHLGLEGATVDVLGD